MYFPNEELILKPDSLSNKHRLIFYEEAFDDFIDKFPSNNVPMVEGNFLREKNIDMDNELQNIISINNTLDLAVPDFHKYSIDIYKEICKRNNIKVERKEIRGYRLLLKI